jgi:hypothetical protein
MVVLITLPTPESEADSNHLLPKAKKQSIAVSNRIPEEEDAEGEQ